jgi:hypothetical protein
MPREVVSAAELIRRFLKNNPNTKYSPAEVAAELKLSYSTAKVALWRLSLGEEVQCNERGKYQWLKQT